VVKKAAVAQAAGSGRGVCVSGDGPQPVGVDAGKAVKLWC